MDKSPAAKFIAERLNGAQVVANKLGRKPSAVRMWACRGVIPRSAWPDLIEKYRGVTLAELKRLEQSGQDGTN